MITSQNIQVCMLIYMIVLKHTFDHYRRHRCIYGYHVAGSLKKSKLRYSL